MMEMDEELDPRTTGVEIAGDARSILDRISEARDQQEDYVVIPIPSWDGALKAKYKLLDADEIQKMIRRSRARAAGGAKSVGMESDADFLIRACIEVIAYDEETDQDYHLSDGFDMTLAGMLSPKNAHGESISIGTPRELVAYLFKWNKLAVGLHAQKLGRWMSDPSVSIEDPQ